MRIAWMLAKVSAVGRALVLFGLCFPLWACSPEHSGIPMDETARRLKLFSESPQELDGERIELRGFLDIHLGSLAIYRDRQSAAKARFENKPIVIRDTSPNRDLRQETIYVERTCTGAYVKLIGVVGFLAEHQFYGISEIIQIRVFSDEGFSGEGRLCYSRDDPGLYAPKEL